MTDTFAHTPGRTHKGDNADVADDFYHRYPQDIKLMQSLGEQHVPTSDPLQMAVPRHVGMSGHQPLQCRLLCTVSRRLSTAPDWAEVRLQWPHWGCAA